MFFTQFEDLCRKIGKSATAVGNELGIPKTTISYWRNNNDVIPKQNFLIKISKYFNVSVDYLLGTEQKEKPTGNKADEPMYNLWNKYSRLSASDKKTIDDMFEFLLSKPEYLKKDNVG